MSFWRKIAGLAVKNLDEAECPDCPPGLPGEDPAFSTAVTALGAKLAKADGKVQAREFDTFADVFQPEPGSEGNVRRLYQLARQTTRGFESYARRLAKRYRHCPQILEDVLDGLFHIASADYLPKPNPATFAKLTRTHDIDPRAAVFFEDSERNLAPAAALGMTTVLVGPRAEASTASFVHHRTPRLAPFLAAARTKES